MVRWSSFSVQTPSLTFEGGGPPLKWGLPLISKRRSNSPEFKSRVAMAAIIGRETIQEVDADHAIHPIQVIQ